MSNISYQDLQLQIDRDKEEHEEKKEYERLLREYYASLKDAGMWGLGGSILGAGVGFLTGGVPGILQGWNWGGEIGEKGYLWDKDVYGTVEEALEADVMSGGKFDAGEMQALVEGTLEDIDKQKASDWADIGTTLLQSVMTAGKYSDFDKEKWRELDFGEKLRELGRPETTGEDAYTHGITPDEDASFWGQWKPVQSLWHAAKGVGVPGTPAYNIAKEITMDRLVESGQMGAYQQMFTSSNPFEGIDMKKFMKWLEIDKKEEKK